MSVDETIIRQWADRHECRRSLPLLVRRLIRETTPSLSSLRFPGNEAIDLPGLDGRCEAEYATAWVPQGRSVWEMGCNQEPRGKADGDYEKRTAETPQDELADSSFVFVTPRRWHTKDEWLEKRRREGSWSAVYAYDAIDLETWLEEAPATSRWLGELLGVASLGLLTPQEWWQKWSTASVPPISRRLVATRRHNEANTLLKKLRDGAPVVAVQADDRSEAIAFVVAALIEADALDLLDRTLVVTSGGIRIPTAGASRLIAIADIPEGQEADFGDRRNITIVRAYSRGRVDVQESVQLSHVPSQTFRSELEAMGLAEDEAESLARKTGHSVPVLRRQRSPDPEVRRPVWARDRASAKQLLPFALTGSWVEREHFHDGIVLQLLGEFADGETEHVRDTLLTLDDAPIAKYGNVNVVVSQLDALFAIGPYIELTDLDRFFQLVPELLGERDPALDLPQDQWWMANVLGKGRSYSGALLSGLGDTLCIFAIHGAEVCGNRLQIDLAYRASQVVRSLMQNAGEERWLSIRDHLRALAEASPNTFLDCLEEELRRPEPTINAIMGTTGGPSRGECLRTDLLWALELLAWHPIYFSRAAGIVFDLQRFEIKDNWSNSPISTARSLFRVWLPATSLDVPERMRVLRNLSGQFRSASMDVCISLLPDGGPGFAIKPARPQWRALEQEVPVPTNIDVRDAAIEASCLLLDLAPFNKAELEKLLQIAPRLHPHDLSRLVGEIEQWAVDADDEEKAELCHDFRRRQMMRAYQDGEDEDELVVSLRRIETALEPVTATARHRWLFESAYVEWRFLVEEEREGHLSWQERDARVRQKRVEAIAEIQEELGEDQVFEFGLSVKQPDLVAQVLVPPDASPEIAAKWIARALEHQPSEAANTFLRQVLWTAGRNDLRAVLHILRESGILENIAVQHRLAEHLPGSVSGWTAAEEIGNDAAATYWSTVSIRIWDDTPSQEIEYAIAKLLDAQRPRSAFAAIGLWPNRLSPEQWEQILQAIAYGQEPDGVLPDAYRLDEVFKRLDEADNFSDERIAMLELPFVPLLCSYGHRHHERTLAVHRELARDPSTFVQLLCWRYHRSDGKDDPGQQEMLPERQKFLSELAYHALEGWNRLPGLDNDGNIVEKDFIAWAEEAMRQAIEADRKNVAETHFGALLARFARRRPWEEWLPLTILDFLDRAENGGLREKFDLGVQNARGVTTRGPYDGGEQERKLAGRYRELAARYGNSHPRVAALLVSIAKGYKWDARRQDERAAVGERWHP
ncbi:hypothetical protein [Brucella sp. IR073]|uniref:hypothetical protein n=1 Tax=unclassified Brucella TaxID=2632610 RepID=UPI003B984822